MLDDKLKFDANILVASGGSVELVSVANFDGGDKVISDLATNISAANFSTLPAFSGGKGALAYATDTGEVFYSADGNFTTGTAVIATLFIICSLGLTILSRGDLAPTSSVLDTVEEKTEDTPSIPENN